jgi:hypothetical protein
VQAKFLKNKIDGKNLRSSSPLVWGEHLIPYDTNYHNGLANLPIWTRPFIIFGIFFKKFKDMTEKRTVPDQQIRQHECTC